VFSFLKPKPKREPVAYPLITDVHSHLLPGIDDGVKTMEESYEVISQLMELGYTRFITTPHVMIDRYPNTSEIILSKLAEVNLFLKEKNVEIELNAAAEYYLDEWLMDKVETGIPLLTFGKNYLLFETNFMVEPFALKEFIFKATSAGYKLVYAHPERYAYMTLQKAIDLRDRGVLLQLNLASLVGYYSRPIQKMAYQLIDNGLVDFLGSDCHNANYAALARAARKNKYFIKAMNLPLLNHTL
jgi:protein-tyrosine phosphatase